MKGLRLLNNGQWNKPPVPTAARRLLLSGLARESPKCPLGQSADFLNGTSYDIEQVSELGQSPIIRISNITNPDSAYLRTTEELNPRFWVRNGDLLVSWSASFKSTIWTGPEGFLNQHIFKVTERAGFARRYIRHAIEGSFEEMQESVVGIGMMHLRRSDFLSQRIPAPPLAVQRAVAKYLDWLEGGSEGGEPALPDVLANERQVVARIKQLTEQIEDARRFRQQAAEEAEALESRAVEEVFARLRRSGAEQVPFEAACRCVTVGQVSSMKHAYRDEGVPFLRSQNVRKNRFEPRGLSFIAPEFHADNPKSMLKPGDVVVVRTGFVGVACVVPRSMPDANCADLVIVRPSERLDPSYASHFLNSPTGRERAVFASVGSAQKHYNVGAMRRTHIPLPPLSEQRRIVAFLDALEAKAGELKQMQEETATELDALLPAILDRAFKGEMG